MIAALVGLVAESIDRILAALNIPHRIDFDPEETP